MTTDVSKVEIKVLTAHDLPRFKELVATFQSAFEMDDDTLPDDDYLQSILFNPGFIAFAIFYENAVIGGATAYILPLYYAHTAELFIYDVAIHPDHQRAGLGNLLMAAIGDYCKQNNIGEMFVPAHEEDTHALEFYKSVGGVPEKVMHFNFSFGGVV